MQVSIKDFYVNMEVKSNGIEFEVRSPDGSAQLGDCIISMTGLVWCKGKTSKAHGVKMTWEDFIAIATSNESLKKAVKAAKKSD